MIEIDADLSVLAKIKRGEQTYELREIEFQHLQKMRDVDTKDNNAVQEALFNVLDASGLPKEVAKTMSLKALKQLESIIIGEYETQKK